MPNQGVAFHGVMEGKGAYNQYAKVPAGGAALALPLLEKTVPRVGLDAGEQAVVIADYGSSQGKNSMIPLQVAIQGFRKRIGASRPISVFHIDQPFNDFNALFGVLTADPDRYLLGEPNVFPAAIGRSFYESVLPPASVHLGWSSYAAMWLSKIPTLSPGHFIPTASTGKVRAEFDSQGAQDWESFLTLRSRELRSGGRIVVVVPALTDEGLSGFESIMDQANAVLGEMVVDGAITSGERARMVIASHLRRKRELLAPFANGGGFEGLSVEDFAEFKLPDGTWVEYEKDGNKEALARKHALFFRAIFMPSLASALDRVRAGDAEALRLFADRLESSLRRRVVSEPRALHSQIHA